MVVALDIDDTITRHPPFFSIVTRALVAAGHEVIIITFREDRLAIEVQLKEWAIAYSRLVTSTTQELLASGPEEWKAQVCRRLNVQVLFEDMPEVLACLDESVVAFMPVDRRKHRLDLIAGKTAPFVLPGGQPR